MTVEKKNGVKERCNAFSLGSPCYILPHFLSIDILERIPLATFSKLKPPKEKS